MTSAESGRRCRFGRVHSMPLIPIVIERSGREERAMDIYSRLLQDRIIILGTAIDDTVANLIVAQMLVLAHQDAKADIHLYINSPGGSVTAGHGHLRHDAVGLLRRGHLLHRPVRQHGLAAAGRRRQGQAERLAARPDHDPPAAGRHGRDRDRHPDPRRRVHPHEEAAQRDLPASTPARRSRGSRKTPTATVSCLPKKLANTA